MDLHSVNVFSIILRLLMASLFGGIIGFERQSTKKPAGLRTHMLICIGSALVMLTGQYVTSAINPSADPTRLGAQVISGIGFLGIGTIIVVSRQHVMGLTTAAGLWASACMGLAIGIGFYAGAIVGGVLIFIVETILRRMDSTITRFSRNMSLYIEVDHRSRIPQLQQHMGGFADIQSMIMTRDQPVHDKAIGLLFFLRLHKKQEHMRIITELMTLDGVEFVQQN